MRDLVRNRRPVWYSNIVSERPQLDEFGNDTGESVKVYGEPVLTDYNVSAATGGAIAEAFGAFADYSRVICTADARAPFVVGTRIWFGVDPAKSGHNYTVVKVADSLNGTLYALREVTVH